MIKKDLLKELGLDDFSKASHKYKQKEKPLAKHIDEILSISKRLAKKHKLTEYTEILKQLAWWHDIGKLNPKWDVHKKIKPPHSALSAYLFLKYSDYENPRLFYLILKHHSHLTPIPSNLSYISKNILGKIKFPIDLSEALKSSMDILREFKNSIKNDKKSNVIYADLFGIFKTADIISAMSEVVGESKLQNISLSINTSTEDIKQRLKMYTAEKGINFDENRWQTFLNMATHKQDVLFSAPTGWGKTFASLTIATRKKPSHIIYVLPTITSIRKMKGTLQKLLQTNVVENYYFADFEKLSGVPSTESSVDWELFLSKSFLGDITLTTLDQILLTFLQVGKYFLKRFHFRNSVFIFDEFHLYPLNGLYILLEFISKFNTLFDYNISTVFMSATVHPELEKLITNKIPIIQYSFVDEYKKKRRYLYSLHTEDILTSWVLEEIIRKSHEGNVLVICNTVEKAIRVYFLLKYYYGAQNILLLHSRFMYKDRKTKEEELERLSKHPSGFIFVATQVAEVSLDVSFDYLFTELASLPALIQRFGRVNRYRSWTDKENVAIFYPNEAKDNRHYPYEINELRTSQKVLQELNAPLKNEFELINGFKTIPMKLDEENFERINAYLERWEDSTGYFFSIDLSDKNLDRLLRFRETNTTLVIPECVIDYIIEILNNLRTHHKISRIKGYFTPIPIWWLFSEDSSPYMKSNLPIFSSSRFLYSSEIGYFDSARLPEVLDYITICKRANIL